MLEYVTLPKLHQHPAVTPLLRSFEDVSGALLQDQDEHHELGGVRGMQEQGATGHDSHGISDGIGHDWQT